MTIKTFRNTRRRLKLSIGLVLVLSFFTEVKGQEYLFLLNPGDCFKSDLQFSQVQHFVNNNQIKVTILTPFTDEVNAKMLMDKFSLNLTQAKLDINVNRYKKYNHEDLNSKLIVEFKNKIIYNEIIATIDTGTIPILEFQRPKIRATFQVKGNSAPYYANDGVIFKNRIVLKNIIYQRLFIQSDSGFNEFKVHDSIYDLIINKKFSKDTSLISKNENFMSANNVSKIKHLALFSGNYLYTIIEIPVLSYDGNTNIPSYHLVKFDSSFNIQSINEIQDEFNMSGNLFWCAFIFDFAVDEIQNRLLLFITRGHDNKKLSKQDSCLYLLASYKLEGDIYKFDELFNNRLPRYYTENEHFYRNLWPKIGLSENLGGLIGFQYLNELKVINGETIFLEGIKADKLILPYNPGGKSNKPFEMITFTFKRNLIYTLLWEKNKIWLYVHTIQGRLVTKNKIMNSFVKPAAVLRDNQLILITATLKGQLTYSHYSF